jgi:hypothetical protein
MQKYGHLVPFWVFYRTQIEILKAGAVPGTGG